MEIDGQFGTASLSTTIIQFSNNKIDSQLSYAFLSMPHGMQAFHFDRNRSMVVPSISAFWPPNPQTKIVSNNPNSIKTESTHKQGGSTVVNPKQLERCVQEPDFALEYLPLLFSAVSSGEESYQNNASEALENCGVPSITAIPILLAQLENGDSSQVYWACTLLGRWFAQYTDTSSQSHSESIQDHV